MKRRNVAALGAAVVLAGVALSAGAQTRPGDWAQWRGPLRDGISKETGLLKQWPQGGPQQLWKTENLGFGYSSPSIAGGRVYGMGYKDNQEVVWALNAADGKLLWSTPFAQPQNSDPDNRGVGPRGTPAVDGNRVYSLGVNGDLVCMDTANGKIVWQKSLVRDFGGRVPGWGYSESPLVDGDKVIVTPGSAEATLVALNKNTGETVWQCAVPGGDQVHYASAIVADVHGTRQYIQFLKGGVVGVAAADGKFLWRFGHAAGNVANCPTPVYSNGHVFASAGYGRGAALGKISKTDAGWTAEEVYRTSAMVNHHGGVILVGENLYGIHDAAGLSCLDFKTGTVKWSDRAVKKGSLFYADGHLYARFEGNGEMTLVEANPAAFTEKGRFAPPRDPNQPPARPQGMAWAHPVVAGGKLYLRDQNTLLCYNVKGAP